MGHYSSKRLDHLGLVSGFCHDFGLVDLIDDELGRSSRHQVSHGERVLSMVLNGLGFVGRTLHMYSEYFEDKALERLIRPGVTSEHLNDDALGRSLDALYEKGVSGLYTKIASKALSHLKLSPNSVHLDSTSFHYDGQTRASEDGNAILLTKGYSRDHRPELNQAVLNLISENKAGIPIYMKAASGNSNDSAAFKAIIKSHLSSMKAAQASRHTVGDAALYTQETIQSFAAQEQLFITRAPQTLKEVKLLCGLAHKLGFSRINADYEGTWYRSDYGDVTQRWLLVRSQAAKQRERGNLEKRIEKAAVKSQGTLKSLCKRSFACEYDARAAFEIWQAKQPFHRAQYNIQQERSHSQAGRPKKGQSPEQVVYKITAELYLNQQAKADAEQQCGLFVLATNDLDDGLDMAQMLSTYKAQQSVEKGFRFLKSPDFLVSSFYLKKPERIEALLMVMTLCLLVYAAVQHTVRQALKHNDKSFPDMKKKPTQKPTARWVFQCFQGIELLFVQMDGRTQEIVMNLKERQTSLLQILGPPYVNIYSLN